MSKKVIAIIRTSTTQQEIESQKNEVLSLALADGYTMDEIEVVGKAGASAIKVDEAYKENMDKVYNLIDTVPTIEAVYAWAIDRIGRKEEILLGFKNRLIDKKIQLIIKNPTLRLLEPNGDINTGVELAFSLFATMAKQEMEQKKARFKRARKRNDEMGKYNGGYVAFGYEVKDGYLVINEAEASVVRLIFEELATGKYSCDSLARELQSRGIKFKGKKLLFSNVRGIVKNKIYCGEQEAASGIVRNLPQIVNKELYNKALRAMQANNPSKTNTTTNRNLLGLRLIKCPYCGCHFSVAAKLYQCHNHNRNYYDSRQGFEKCPNGISIGVNNLDRLLWYVAASVHFDYIQELKSVRKKEIDDKIEILTQKINHIQTEIELLADKKSRINDVYMDGDISKEERDNRLSKLIRDNEDNLLNKRDYENEIVNLNALKNGDLEREILFDNLHNLILLEDKEQQCKIARLHIKNIILEKSQYKHYKRVLKITIQFFNNPDQQYLYIAKSVGEFYPLYNGELVVDKKGELEAIPDLNEFRKLDGIDDTDVYIFTDEILRIKDKLMDDVDIYNKIQQKYNLTVKDMQFIDKTHGRFYVGNPDAIVKNRINSLLKKGVILKLDNKKVFI